jgi:lipopolysaccharide export system protein LptA
MSSCGPEQFATLANAFARALVFFLCLPATIAYSLPDDRDQPIHITADKALRNEVDGVTIYSGNVELVQGSMELEADKLTIFHTTDTADEIIAEGRPAKMRQQPELDKGIVHAHAKVITYFKNEDRIHLQTDARIEQEGAVVDGDAIDYFIAKQLITAESDQSQENNKVVVVIPPSPPKEDSNETLKEPGAEENTTTPATQIVEEGTSGTTASE